MRVARLGAIVALTAIGTVAGADISLIEFFGYRGIDIERLRSVLPVKEGDPYNDPTKDAIREAVMRALGKQPTDVAAICCDQNGGRLVFIGLPGASFQAFAYRAVLQGTERLPVSLMNLYTDLDRAIEAAVRKGGDAAQEDDSQGFGLIKDPIARSLQLKVRQWAVDHERELLSVLDSSALVEHRRVASDALGFARQSNRQIQSLVRAARDPDDDVRNNATRALGALVRSNPKLAKQVNPESFIGMLKSGVWSDRNKAAHLLMQLTASRSSALLGHIRAEALEALMEMASWRQASHAFFARVLLGRIAGMPEKQLNELAWDGDPQDIIEAVRRTKV